MKQEDPAHKRPGRALRLVRLLQLALARFQRQAPTKGTEKAALAMEVSLKKALLRAPKRH